MKEEVKDSPYIGKNIAYFDGDGNIGKYEDGSDKHYIVEKVYLMGSENISYICFLLRLSAYRSHGQLEWEVVDGDPDTTEYKFWKDHIEKNRKEYKWVNE